MLDLAIVGAGPYGLSLAAHARRLGLSFRIFGRAMDSWVAHMPKGMMLKSDGFASDIFDPDGSFSLRQFCAERQIEYSDVGVPVRLETFTAYGLAFRERFVPELEEKLVISLDHTKDGFTLKLDDGELVKSRRVVLAIGITHFQRIPDNLAHLSSEFLSHSYCHRDLEAFRGRTVIVLGGGASATDLAALLHEIGAEVQLVAKRDSLKFHSKPEVDKPRSFWQRIRHPQSGLGPGLRSRFYANSSVAFHYLPRSMRMEIVRTHLGPSGGWFIKDKVVGKIPLLLGYSIEYAEAGEGKVNLIIRGANGSKREVSADHIIAATGYRVDLNRLKFLSRDILSELRLEDSTPILSSTFESSIPGLYFVGLAAANSFGPAMRFAFGAGFAARRLTKSIARSVSRARAFRPAGRVTSLRSVNNEETRAI